MSDICIAHAGRFFAAPSWVKPGSIEENCIFLTGKVYEIGLLFMESGASLAYTARDLPDTLSLLPLRWHVHLPVDLPWESGESAAKICLELMNKVTHLGAVRAVLHPPILENAGKRIIEKDLKQYLLNFSVFFESWKAAGRNVSDIFVENLLNSPLHNLKNIIMKYGAGVCLDLGHVLQYLSLYGKPAKNLEEMKWALGRTGIFHAAGISADGRHGPLTVLRADECRLAKKIVAALPVNCLIMLESFDWKDIGLSFNVMRGWLDNLYSEE